VYARPLENGDIAALVLNDNDTLTLDIELTWDMLDVDSDTTLSLRDLWQHKELGTYTEAWTAVSVPVHGCRMLRISKK